MFLVEVGVVYFLHFPRKCSVVTCEKFGQAFYSYIFVMQNVLDADTKHQQAAVSSDQRSCPIAGRLDLLGCAFTQVQALRAEQVQSISHAHESNL